MAAAATAAALAAAAKVEVGLAVTMAELVMGAAVMGAADGGGALAAAFSPRRPCAAALAASLAPALSRCPCPLDVRGPAVWSAHGRYKRGVTMG